jgi:hypothetical protein
MARDRQRAKQRRRRQGGAAPRDRRTQARDIGLDDATVEDSGLGDGTPAPDPLKNSSAEVDEAKLAEAGAVHPDADEEELDYEPGQELGPDELPDGVYEDELHDDDFERAPDEAEGDAVPTSRAAHPEIAH